MGRSPVRETTKPRRERLMIKDPKAKAERVKTLNRDRAKKWRGKQKDSIKGLTKNVKELNQIITEKDSEIRNLKMKLESLQGNRKASTDPRAPEAPIFQDLAAQDASVEPESFDRPDELPRTVPEKSSTETLSSVVDKICVGKTPADYKKIFKKLIHDSPTQSLHSDSRDFRKRRKRHN